VDGNIGTKRPAPPRVAKHIQRICTSDTPDYPGGRTTPTNVPEPKASRQNPQPKVMVKTNKIKLKGEFK
jgi:hypothetical protein